VPTLNSRLQTLEFRGKKKNPAEMSDQDLVEIAFGRHDYMPTDDELRRVAGLMENTNAKT
jgi:hypothetical protein